MTTTSDTRKPQRQHLRMTGPTSPQNVLERPTQPSTGTAAPEPSGANRPVRRLGWAAAVAVTALAIVGAIALSTGEDVDRLEASTPSPELVATAGVSTSDGYWNPYTLEWVTLQTTNTTPTADGYWNPYTLEWVALQTASTTPTADGYWNPYTLEWVTFEN